MIGYTWLSLISSLHCLSATITHIPKVRAERLPGQGEGRLRRSKHIMRDNAAATCEWKERRRGLGTGSFNLPRTAPYTLIKKELLLMREG